MTRQEYLATLSALLNRNPGNIAAKMNFNRISAMSDVAFDAERAAKAADTKLNRSVKGAVKKMAAAHARALRYAK